METTNYNRDNIAKYINNKNDAGKICNLFSNLIVVLDVEINMRSNFFFIHSKKIEKQDNFSCNLFGQQNNFFFLSVNIKIFNLCNEFFF